MIDRIKKLIAYMDLSERAFAIKCGIKPNTFNNQLTGARELSLATANAILSSNEDISAEWLLRGQGSMLLSEKTNDPNIERIERLVDTIATLQATINEKTKTIQLLDEENQRLKRELNIKNERKIG